jgi:putative DNA primase/helicase
MTERHNQQEHNHDVLEHYRDAGWKLVKADPETKGGVDHQWQLRDVSLAEVRRYLVAGGGVGVQVGEVSSWLGVADADHEHAISTAPAFLPETLTQAKGAEVSHRFYYCEGLGYRQFNDLSGNRLIDIKASVNGAGHLVVLEPTRHPRKGSYRFVGGFNPAAIAHVPLPELDRSISLWACCSLIAAELPKSREEGEGGRHDISNAIAGFGLRNGWTEEETLKVLLAAWKARNAPDKALRALERNVVDTADKLSRDEPCTGGRTLEELMPGLPGRIAKFMGWQRADRREGQSHNLTDMGNAERFIDQHGHMVRYCYEWASWLVWDGTRWVRDVGGGRVRKLAKETVRSIYHEAAEIPEDDLRKAIAKHAARSEATTKIDAMLKQAECELPITPAELDSDPCLLNCLNGTINLKTGELLDHDQAHYLTKLAPVEYDPNAKAPTFDAFLERVQPKEAVRGFLKRAVGYSATADTTEQCMFIDHGSGMNGKSTFAEAIAAALGDYAQRAPTEMLMVRRSGGIPNDVARLKGARFVAASETEEGRRLAESLVKDLTGSDTITARFMRAEFFDFTPTHKLWLSTNHKPEIRGTDLAIWRRIRLVPWSVKIPPAERDTHLPRKIREELPGVLAWIVKGCLEWRDRGLNPPEDVRAATQAYRAESDVLAGFLADCCKIGETETEYAAALWKAWGRWAEENGEPIGTQTRFGSKLRERGFLNSRDGKTGRKKWRGLSLWPDWEDRAGVTVRGSNSSTLRFAGNSEQAEQSEPKNNISSSKTHRDEFMRKNGSDCSEGSGKQPEPEETSFVSSPARKRRRLTEDEAIEAQKLIAEGMAPALARAEVLKEDAPY